MNRITKASFTSFLVLLLVIPSTAVGAPAKPNIVVILADDMGYGDVHALDPASKIPTPNIDRLATEGMTFVDGHSPSAVCTPTRYGLLTGRYCWRTRLKSGVLGGYTRTSSIVWLRNSRSSGKAAAASPGDLSPGRCFDHRSQGS